MEPTRVYGEEETRSSRKNLSLRDRTASIMGKSALCGLMAGQVIDRLSNALFKSEIGYSPSGYLNSAILLTGFGIGILISAIRGRRSILEDYPQK